MVSVVLASHGSFASGIKESGQMIFGPQDDVAAVTLTPDMGPADFKKKLQDAIASFSEQEHILFLVDLWGGTPFNQVSGLLAEGGHEDWCLVTGLNLPMLIEAYSMRDSMTAKELAVDVFGASKEGVRIQPEELQPKEAAATPAAAAAPAPMGAIPEGTVLGDGHIKFVLVRIDTRLLHGQVATTWTKQTQPDRIIVVSDNVAHDDLRKTMIKQAAPPGVKAHVIPISKMIEVAKDPRFGATKAMLLFETPQDLLRAVEGGVDIKHVNLGSMAGSAGKVVANQAIAMDQDDYDTLMKIKDKGIDFEVRKVPSDSAEDFDKLMAKAKGLLDEQKNA